MQELDRLEGLVGIQVPEREAGGAVFEKGAGGFEGEGSGAACYCSGR